MSLATFRIGLRHCPGRTTTLHLTAPSHPSISSLIASRQLSTISLFTSRSHNLTSKTTQALTTFSKTPFTPTRPASTTANPLKTNPNQPPSTTLLSWNDFFRLRTSRRRYSLISSLIGSLSITTAAFLFLSTQPETADEITKLMPLDPVISMGILTFAATFLGWLVGPIFGNTVWKVFHRARLAEFTVKERTFFERVKRHRVNPMGASANNPVPDYYGEKIGSVSGYRRWLRDQRAFNRKREGSYPGGI